MIKKYIPPDSGQKIYVQGGKKKFPPYMYKKKIRHAPLKIPTPPHPPPPPLSPITILMVHPLDSRGRVLSNYFHLSLHLI